MSPPDTLLTGWAVSGIEMARARFRRFGGTAGTRSRDAKGEGQVKKSETESTEARTEDGPTRSSAEVSVMDAQPKGSGCSSRTAGQLPGEDEPVKSAKPFVIAKRLVWEAYQRVKANRGAAGIDGQTIEEFDRNQSRNLYRIWNRMSSGSYFPPAVKAVPIPKKSGGERVLGVPTVSDRIAQTVVTLVLEPVLEPVFHDDSYGYRRGKSAHDALAVTRKRCWERDWVLEYDIRGLFDNINHGLLLKALRHHCDDRWVLLYVERWLTAPVQGKDGLLDTRTVGTPQGGPLSPVLNEGTGQSGPGPAPHAGAARCNAPADRRARTRAGAAGRQLSHRDLARRYQRSALLALCAGTGARRARQSSPRRRMVAHRMAQRRSRANALFPVHPARRHCLQAAGGHRQDALAHRA